MGSIKTSGKIKTYSEWLKPKLVENALELLDKEIPKFKNQIKFVHLCFMTDPFMYKYREVKEMTLKILARFAEDNIRCTVLTKGVFPKELVDTSKYGKNNEYGITLVSLNEGFKRRYEPYSAPFLKRIVALKYLSDSGLKTWVSIEPYLTPNLIEQDLLKLLNHIAFTDKIIFGKLNYNTDSTMFKENQEFYKLCAGIVKDFCESRGIDCHIKYGTERQDNKKTSIIFKKVSSLAQQELTIIA